MLFHKSETGSSFVYDRMPVLLLGEDSLLLGIQEDGGLWIYWHFGPCPLSEITIDIQLVSSSLYSNANSKF